MKAKELKEYLLEDLYRVRKVLESIGCHSLWETGDEIRCAPPDSPNHTAISVNIETLYTCHYRRDDSFRGDIIGLVQELRDESFPEALRYIKSLFGLTSKYVKEDKKDPLSTFKAIRKSHKKIESLDEIVDEVPKFGLEAISDFILLPHISLLYEGIMPQTAELFKIGYDPILDRIIFPHFNYDDKNAIVGITGRTTRSKEEIEQLMIPKYWNYIKGYKKMYNLYGFSHSLKFAIENKLLVIFEAEKSVLKNHTQTRNKGFSCSVGGHEISSVQLQIIMRYLPVDVEVCIAFDKDIMSLKDRDGNLTDEDGNLLGELYLKKHAERFSKYRKASYIFDSDNLLDDFDSPIDKGYKIFHRLLDERRVV